MRDKLPLLVAAVTIGVFAARLTLPAHEYPSQTGQMMTMLFDAGLVFSAIVMRNRMPAWLFWVALLCGLGLFGVRFTSDAAWWTGHLRYEVLPR